MTAYEDLADRAERLAGEIAHKVRTGTLDTDAMPMADLLHTFAKQVRRGQLTPPKIVGEQIAERALKAARIVPNDE